MVEAVAPLSLSDAESPVWVRDYRYKKMRGKRIFPSAEYTLMPSQAWKSDADPELSARQEEWLRHGPKYGRYPIPRKTLMVWGLMEGELVLPLALWFFSRPTKHKATQRGTETNKRPMRKSPSSLTGVTGLGVGHPGGSPVAVRWNVVARGKCARGLGTRVHRRAHTRMGTT